MYFSTFQALVVDAGYNARSYSGRGMYGESCLGVVVPRGRLGEFLGDVIAELHEASDDDESSEEAHTVTADAFRVMKTDELGRDMIAYFPGILFDASADSGADDSADEG